MRKVKLLTILVLFCCLSPFVSISQYQYLVLDKAQVYFEKGYDIDSLDAAGISTLLVANIPHVKGLTGFSKVSDVITAKFDEGEIDYKKYGGKWASTAAYLNHPFTGNVVIVWKDKKYKVTVNNIDFGGADLAAILTKKKGTEFTQNKTNLVSGQYIEKYLADLFAISSKKTDW